MELHCETSIARTVELLQPSDAPNLDFAAGDFAGDFAGDLASCIANKGAPSQWQGTKTELLIAFYSKGARTYEIRL